MPAKPVTPSEPAISTTRSSSLPVVMRSRLASPPPGFGWLRNVSFDGTPKTRASPRTSKDDLLAATRRSASRASAPSGRFLKVPLLTTASTSKSMASGPSFRLTGNDVRTIRSDGPEASIFIRSNPVAPPMPRRLATRMASPISPDNFRSVVPSDGLPLITGAMVTLPVDRASPSTFPSVRMISPRFSAIVSRPSRLVKAGIFLPSSSLASLSVMEPFISVILGFSPSKRL